MTRDRTKIEETMKENENQNLETIPSSKNTDDAEKINKAEQAEQPRRSPCEVQTMERDIGTQNRGKKGSIRKTTA